MEGQKPLPDATHNFPANPNIWKFWGTPLQKEFFATLRWYVFYSFLVVGANHIASRYETGDFNLKTWKTSEEYEQSEKASKHYRYLQDLNLSLHIRPLDLGGGTYPVNHTTPDIVFDDGIDFVRPKKSGPNLASA